MSRPPKTNRRQFLIGTSAREVLGHQLDATGIPAEAPADHARPLMHLSRQAMACTFTIFLDAQANAAAVNAAMEALDLLDEIEDKLSIYRDHSEISSLNQAQGARVRLSPDVFHLLQRAKQIHAMTEGAFDVTAGPLARVWGFSQRQPRTPSDAQLTAALASVGSDGLELEPQGCWARLARPHMEVNLGGIGKGYALDRCAEWLNHAGVTDFLIQGGLSSVIARGERVPNHSGWSVEIKHPQDHLRVLARVPLRQQALGTSGAEAQHFYDEQGRQLGHVIDPRSGRPADAVVSVTAVAPDGATADALATACYVLGPEQTRQLCERESNLGAVFVQAGQAEFHTRGFGVLQALDKSPPCEADS